MSLVLTSAHSKNSYGQEVMTTCFYIAVTGQNKLSTFQLLYYTRFNFFFFFFTGQANKILQDFFVKPFKKTLEEQQKGILKSVDSREF